MSDIGWMEGTKGCVCPCITSKAKCAFGPEPHNQKVYNCSLMYIYAHKSTDPIYLNTCGWDIKSNLNMNMDA